MTKAPIDAGVTVAQARQILSSLFRAQGIESAQTDARLLIGRALALDAAQLAANPDRAITRAESEQLNSLAGRRLRHEPVARITGEKEFWGLALSVSEAALVPRPETETLVEAALDSLGDRHVDALRIADLGTGTGALLLALLRELPNAFGIATDLSGAALSLARANARRWGFTERACFVQCHYAQALRGGFDLVLSNPPYVASAAVGDLDADVKDYDPKLALDGGIDGLDAYRSIAADARRLLARQGLLIVELGEGQESAVSAIMASEGLTAAGAARRDLAGHPRALILRALP